MTIKRLFIALFLMLVMVAATLPAQAQQKTAATTEQETETQITTDPRYPPIAKVSEIVHDFGVVKPGTTINWDFQVRNDGVGTLLIKNVSPG